jgi:hypothetical protein
LTELTPKGLIVELLEVEVCANGLAAPSNFSLLKKVALRGGARTIALKDIAGSALLLLAFEVFGHAKLFPWPQG